MKVANMLDGVGTVTTQAATNANLSPDGKRDFVRKHIGGVTIKHLANARAISKSRRDDIANWEARLAPPPVDKTDATAVSVRSEIRSVVRGMSAPQRQAFLARPDLPRDVFSALFEGPEFLSGIDSKQRADLQQSYRSTYHAADVAQIAHMREAVELFDAVVQIASNDAASAGGFSSHEFANFEANGGK
jgi:hypothetical protein